MMVRGKDLQITGGLIRIARLRAEKFDYIDDAPSALADLRASGSRIDLFTFLQKLPRSTPEHDYPMEWDNVAALAISTYDEWWTTNINGKTRNMVRKAEKSGIIVREVAFDDDFVRGITAIYNETPTRQGKPFWHYGKNFETVRAENGTFATRSIFIGAYLGDELIGFAKLVADEERIQAGLMQIVSMVEHRDKAPTNALLAQSVRSCAARGIPYLVYSSFAYGKKLRDSLSDFKEHNGFKRVDLPRYYVPLTVTGRAALKLGLHHRFADRLPEPLLVRLRKMRSFWIARKRPAAKERITTAT
jgi:hypothetical protein